MIAAHPVQAMSSFYLPWLAAAAAVAQSPDTPALLPLVTVGGIALPVVQLVLAVVGVLVARWIAPRSAPTMPLGKSIALSVILMLVAATWVVEYRPSGFKTLVYAIGIGFSGYSLIELAGAELRETVATFFRALRARITKLMGTEQ